MDSRILAGTLSDFLYDLEHPIDERTSEWWKNKLKDTVASLRLSSPAEESQDGEDALDLAMRIIAMQRPENGVIADMIQAYASRVARPMPDLTGEIAKIAEALVPHCYQPTKGSDRPQKYHERLAIEAMQAIDRIEQAVKG